MKRVLFWIKCARYQSFPQSLLPGITALVIASKESTFSWALALLALLAIILAHFSFNLFDDYFDFKKNDVKIREQINSGGMRARIGKCDYLLSGKATLPQLLCAALTFGAFAFAIGLFFLFYWGFPIALFIFLLGFLGISYSGPPFRFSYHGMGELLIGFVFGPLLMSGLYFASSGILSPSIWFLAFPVGLLVSNILFTHDIMDFEADKRSGKQTLCVIINNQKTNLIVSLFFIFIPYLIILTGVVFHYISSYMLLIFITLPHAFKLRYLLVRFVEEPKREFQPTWWIQPMEQWKAIQKAGIDWFMIRWYLSRNLLVFFCAIIIIVTMLG